MLVSLKRLGRTRKKSILTAIKHMENFLTYLENRYFNPEIFKRINPDYPKEILSRQLSQIQKGEIVTDRIPNPLKLLHELYIAYNAANNRIPLQVTAATILTLWHYYVSNTSRWRT